MTKRIAPRCFARNASISSLRVSCGSVGVSSLIVCRKPVAANRRCVSATPNVSLHDELKMTSAPVSSSSQSSSAIQDRSRRPSEPSCPSTPSMSRKIKRRSLIA
jgi:hypothetical protein